jgi:putative FmdB family regulatory protein
MPIYEYGCPGCGLNFDQLKAMSERKFHRCPACGDQAQQQVTAPTRAIIRGEPGGTVKNIHAPPRIKKMDTSQLPYVGRDGRLYNSEGK